MISKIQSHLAELNGVVPYLPLTLLRGIFGQHTATEAPLRVPRAARHDAHRLGELRSEARAEGDPVLWLRIFLGFFWDFLVENPGKTWENPGKMGKSWEDHGEFGWEDLRKI